MVGNRHGYERATSGKRPTMYRDSLPGWRLARIDVMITAGWVIEGSETTLILPGLVSMTGHFPGSHLRSGSPPSLRQCSAECLPHSKPSQYKPININTLAFDQASCPQAYARKLWTTFTFAFNRRHCFIRESFVAQPDRALHRSAPRRVPRGAKDSASRHGLPRQCRTRIPRGPGPNFFRGIKCASPLFYRVGARCCA
jgi:hypothetical protein